MPETTNNTIQQSMFAANRQQVSGGSISRVLCLLEPKAILVAGLNAQGEVFSAKSFTNTATEWDTDFFTSVCRNELLLRDMKQVKAVFVATHKQTPVPDALFNADQAAILLRSMFHVQRDEVILSAPLPADKAKLVYALPADIVDMIQQTFGKVNMIPVTAGICIRPESRAEQQVDCLLTPGKAFAALHVNGVLQWQQVFDFTNAEDIAYRLGNVCRQNNIAIADVHVNCMASHESLTPVIAELETYYPKIKYAGGNMVIDERQWLPVLYLLQQLNVCAS
jgi:hypothetical protein